MLEFQCPRCGSGEFKLYVENGVVAWLTCAECNLDVDARAL